MRKQIKVEVEDIMDVADFLAENELTNEIMGITEDEEIIIEIQYSMSERHKVYELADLLEPDKEEEEN